MKRSFFLLLLLIGCAVSVRSESGWKACWINTERCQSATNTWLAFRKTVHIDKVPQRLTARIAADSKYWLWINGRLVVFEGGLKRGSSPYDTYYDPVEIAPYLQNGENTIAVLVWHFGKSGFSHVNSGLAALLFEAIAPGIEIVSDKSWQCAVYDAYQNTGAPYPNFRLPESNIRFDARMEMARLYGLDAKCRDYFACRGRSFREVGRAPDTFMERLWSETVCQRPPVGCRRYALLPLAL